MDANTFHEKLVQAVKDVGQDIIDNAEDYVGSASMLSDMTITVRFDPDFGMLAPTIEVEKNYLCKKAVDRLMEE